MSRTDLKCDQEKYWLTLESPWPGGASRFLIEVARKLYETGQIAGICVSVGALTKEDQNDLGHLGHVKVFRPFPLYGWLHKGGRFRRLARHLVQGSWAPVILLKSAFFAVSQRKRRLIVFSGGYPGTPTTTCLALLSQLLFRKTLLIVLSMPRSVPANSKFGKAWLDQAVSRLGLPILTNSETQLEAFVKMRAVPSQSMHSCMNPLDTSNYCSPRERSADAPLKLVYLGRLDRLKGVDSLLQALNRLDRTSIRVHLTVIGDGPERRNLETLAQRLGLTDFVEFAGFVPDVSISNLKEFHVGILPSLWEGLPYSILDYSLAGICSIATDVGAVQEVILDGVSGLLVSAGSPEEIAGAVETLYMNESLRLDLAIKGQEIVREKFSVEHWLIKFEQIFKT